MILKTIKNNRAFSIMGVLVASVIGFIVIAGLTKMFVHMSSQFKTLEQKMQQTHLVGLISNYMRNPAHCKKTLEQVDAQIKAGTNVKINAIKTANGGDVINIVTEKSKLQTKYGIGGYTVLELQCQNNCNSCAPCTQRWVISLISQTYVNDIPTFNRVMEIPISVIHTATDFSCS